MPNKVSQPTDTKLRETKSRPVRTTRMPSGPAPTGATLAAKYTPELTVLMQPPDKTDPQRIARAIKQTTALQTVDLAHTKGLTTPTLRRRTTGVPVKDYHAALHTLSGLLPAVETRSFPSSMFVDLSATLPGTALDLTQDVGKIVCLSNLVAILDSHTQSVPENLRKIVIAASKAVAAKRHLTTLSQAAPSGSAKTNSALHTQFEALRIRAKNQVQLMTDERFSSHLEKIFAGIRGYVESLVTEGTSIGLRLTPELAHSAASYLYAFFSSSELHPTYTERCAQSVGLRRLLACIDPQQRPASWRHWVADTGPLENIFGMTAQNLVLKTLLGPYKAIFPLPRFRPWQFYEYALGGSRYSGRLIMACKETQSQNAVPKAQTWVVVFVEFAHIKRKSGSFTKGYEEIIEAKYKTFHSFS